MEKNSGLHLVNKRLGETPLEAIQRFKKENLELDFLPMTYAGRLDPMAEGLLLILSGEKVHEKEKYLNLEKEYEFEILWGFESDTLDILGLVLGSENKSPEESDIQKYLEKAVGKFQQLYPAYSSRPVNGKSLFEWAREGKISEIDIPKHEVEIFSADFIERRKMDSEDLLKEVLEKINLVNGDFRQEEIKEKWKKILHGKEKDFFVIDKIKLKVSSGLYIRQFVFDLAKYFGQIALTLSIKRTKVGEFST